MEKLLARRAMHQQHYIAAKGETESTRARDRLLFFAFVIFDEWWCIEYVCVHVLSHPTYAACKLKHFLTAPLLSSYVAAAAAAAQFGFYHLSYSQLSSDSTSQLFLSQKVISNFVACSHFYFIVCCIYGAVWLVHSFTRLVHGCCICMYHPKWYRITNTDVREKSLIWLCEMWKKIYGNSEREINCT